MDPRLDNHRCGRFREDWKCLLQYIVIKNLISIPNIFEYYVHGRVVRILAGREECIIG